MRVLVYMTVCVCVKAHSDGGALPAQLLHHGGEGLRVDASLQQLHTHTEALLSQTGVQQLRYLLHSCSQRGRGVISHLLCRLDSLRVLFIASLASERRSEDVLLPSAAIFVPVVIT